MSADLQTVSPEQLAHHEAAVAKMKSFKYTEPKEGFVCGKGMVPLARTEVLKAIVPGVTGRDRVDAAPDTHPPRVTD